MKKKKVGANNWHHLWELEYRATHLEKTMAEDPPSEPCVDQVNNQHNIGSLQYMKIRENNTLHDFMQWCDQGFLQVETYNMDAFM